LFEFATPLEEQKLRKNRSSAGTNPETWEPNGALAETPNLDDPRAILALLETDQVVAEKSRTRFGQRNFSLGVKVMLWSLRGYVVLMFVIVVIAVLRAVYALH
jgi:hypothetical protein